MTPPYRVIDSDTDLKKSFEQLFISFDDIEDHKEFAIIPFDDVLIVNIKEIRSSVLKCASMAG